MTPRAPRARRESIPARWLYHRPLLGRLCQAAYQTARDVISAALPAEEALIPGMIAVVQTFGDDLGWHPHVHALVTRGGWDRAGTWVPVPFVDGEAAALLFRHKVFSFLQAEGLIVFGTIPCSRLHASCTARRRLVSSIACFKESVITSAYRITAPLRFLAARPIVWKSEVLLLRYPSLSAFKPGSPSRVRCERTEMPMMAGARRGENRSRTRAVRRHGLSPEYARQRGKIRPRGRRRLGFPGGDRHQRDLRQVQPLVQQVDPHQHVERAAAKVRKDCRALEHLDLAVEVAHAHAELREVLGQVSCRPGRPQPFLHT